MSMTGANWSEGGRVLIVMGLFGAALLYGDGGPPVKAPTRHGFGGKVIKSMIEQLKGQTRFDWRPEGLVCEITLQA